YSPCPYTTIPNIRSFLQLMPHLSEQAQYSLKTTLLVTERSYAMKARYSTLRSAAMHK
ncbi:hypothetical protein EV182_005529, partial [Spiromyces aspiralis]